MDALHGERDNAGDRFPPADETRMPAKAARITVPDFTALKRGGKKISVLTAYDYPTAALIDAAGVEAILVGDSMSMVVQGHDSTLPVTLDEMIYHAEMVGRAVEHALVIVDMPFPSFHLGTHKAIENAGRILKESRCQAVKLEGAAVAIADDAREAGAVHQGVGGQMRAELCRRCPFVGHSMDDAIGRMILGSFLAALKLTIDLNRRAAAILGDQANSVKNGRHAERGEGSNVGA